MSPQRHSNGTSNRSDILILCKPLASLHAPRKLIGVLLGLAGNALVAIGISNMLQVGSCGDPGLRTCPDSMALYFASLMGGMLLSLVGTVAGSQSSSTGSS
jgi:hypothetical protein